MATQDEVVEIILRPMLSLYRAPSGMDSDEERLVALRTHVVRALMPFPASVLRRAWDRVVARHWGWEWPTIQEIVREANLCS